MSIILLYLKVIESAKVILFVQTAVSSIYGIWLVRLGISLTMLFLILIIIVYILFLVHFFEKKAKWAEALMNIGQTLLSVLIIVFYIPNKAMHGLKHIENQCFITLLFLFLQKK